MVEYGSQYPGPAHLAVHDRNDRRHTCRIQPDVTLAALRTAGGVRTGIGTQNGLFDECQEDAAMIPCAIAHLKVRLNRKEEGQGLVEYGLVLMLVSIGSIMALMGLSTAITELFQEIAAVLP
jgi:Flp pilus assembly pilin Flp